MAEIVDVFFNGRPSVACSSAARLERNQFFARLLAQGTSKIKFGTKIYEVVVKEAKPECG